MTILHSENETTSTALSDYEPYGRITWKPAKLDESNSTVVEPPISPSELILAAFANVMAKDNIRRVSLNLFSKGITLELSGLEDSITRTALDNPHSFRIQIFAEFRELFDCGKSETFEDGIQSEFVRQLILLINKYQETAYEVLTALISGLLVDTDAASEALRWIGRMETQAYYQKRRWLLEHSLSSPSARIRDGAILGLGAMDDPHALRYVRKAFRAERNQLLRQSMQQLIDQLQDTLLEA